MKVYLAMFDTLYAKNGKLLLEELDSVGAECCYTTVEIFSSLEVALDYLETEGMKCNGKYSVESYRGYPHRITDFYWYDKYDVALDGTYEVTCAWIEEREIIESVDYFFDDDLNMYRRCCGNCKHWNCYYDDEMDFEYCDCIAEDCPYNVGYNANNSPCKYFIACDEPFYNQINEPLYNANSQI